MDARLKFTVKPDDPNAHALRDYNSLLRDTPLSSSDLGFRMKAKLFQGKPKQKQLRVIDHDAKAGW